MATDGVTILGGGNTAFAVAGNLALRGLSVTLAELPTFAWTVEPIRESRAVRLEGVAGSKWLQSRWRDETPVREGIFASFVLPHNDRLYRPASSVLHQLASNDSSQQGQRHRDPDNRYERR